MIDGNVHSARVDEWLRQVPKELDLEPLLRHFEKTFNAIVSRAHQTLGEVTLLAILDRVLYVAVEQYSIAAALEIEGTEVHCRNLYVQTGQLTHDQAVLLIRFVLVEFLSVLGNLTAEILTPALHAQLAIGSRAERDDGPRALQLSSPRSREASER